MRAWDLATSTPWAITEAALETIVRIAARENPSLEAIRRELGVELENTQRAEVLDGGIALIPVAGPLFRHANLFTQVSGATSVEVLANDIGTALDDSSVRAIVFDVDSPGGEVNGVSEIGDLIYDARSAGKPMVTFVSGDAASGGYWIATSAEKVVVADTAILGSIGVRMTLVDQRKRLEKAGIEIIEIVSSQSPRKVVDPAEEDGRNAIQELLDATADVFIAKVARNRGVSAEKVIGDFGRGWVLVGQKAVDARMADRVGTLEGVIAELREQTKGASGAGNFSIGGTQMPKTTDAPKTDAQEPQVTAAYIAEHHPDVAAELRRAGAKAENERLAAIDEAALAGHEKLIAECKADLACTAEAAALKVVKAEKAKGDQRLALLKGDEEALGEDAPRPSATTNATGDPGAFAGDGKDREEAARILKAAGPKASEEAARILKAAAG